MIARNTILAILSVCFIAECISSMNNTNLTLIKESQEDTDANDGEDKQNGTNSIISRIKARITYGFGYPMYGTYGGVYDGVLSQTGIGGIYNNYMGCRYWCPNSYMWDFYCCDGYTDMMRYQCPMRRSYCYPPYRHYMGQPQICYNRMECPRYELCCPDACVNAYVCKPAEPIYGY
ncbi:uncharacterized protein [Palaemon carinicauda]|uniref:uncharacterized protein n=1 Tax=Palaemon carinicauda TaxID=392227 RepID=UPI0035B696A5